MLPFIFAIKESTFTEVLCFPFLFFWFAGHFTLLGLPFLRKWYVIHCADLGLRLCILVPFSMMLRPFFVFWLIWLVGFVSAPSFIAQDCSRASYGKKFLSMDFICVSHCTAVWLLSNVRRGQNLFFFFFKFNFGYLGIVGIL